MRLLHDTIPYWGDEPDEQTQMQMAACERTADRVAFMADHHLGYAVPVGGVVAYREHISPSGVGYDIACGNKAVRLDVDAAEVRSKIGVIMDDVFSALEFGVGRRNQESVDHELFDDPAWKLESVAKLKEMARQQLGTIGSGNHYVDLFVDEQERVWVGVHFGSRGLGHKTATWFLHKAGATDAIHAEPALLHVDSQLGQEYVEAMQLAGRYAYAGRDWVCGRVAKILGASIVEEVHNHHNFAWKEEHEGETLWVVRKGATPAFPGQLGFVGGSMAEDAVILKGREAPTAQGRAEQQMALYSTVHGAGRVLSRSRAKGKVNKRTGEVVRPPEVTGDMLRQSVAAAGVTLRGAGVDESPHCYKRLPEVLAEHAATVEIVHRLHPIGVAMAGPEVFDPYKD
ncbi:MAG: RtcB family protein [Acidobacteria bacterium]|nr:RtcB family protein [Acidobacteriota bacterium]